VPQKYITCFSFGKKLTSANNFCIGRSIDVKFCFITSWLATGSMAVFFGTMPKLLIIIQLRWIDWEKAWWFGLFKFLLRCKKNEFLYCGDTLRYLKLQLLVGQNHLVTVFETEYTALNWFFLNYTKVHITQRVIQTIALGQIFNRYF
jgi:hypothetical protein